MSAGVGTMPGRRAEVVDAIVAWARRNTWTLGLIGLLIVFLALTKMLQPNYGAPGIQGLAISILPIAFAAVAQAIVVISGGIDLSVGPMMALASVPSAVLM
jgi:ribose transport system permease protein